MTDEKKRTYPAETLGLPPLKMVLVNAEGEHAPLSARPQSPRPRRQAADEQQREEIVLRLIEHLIEKS
ncbi:MAG: hypothetical protein ACP5QU_03240 [Anaerolineae bacterium]